MKIRSIFLHVALAMVAQAAFGGVYQRAKDGKTLIWNNDPKAGEELSWSGKRDKNRFATGFGTLTLYKVAPTLITGSNIPDPRRHAVVVAKYSGEMVQGKFEGNVSFVDATGKNSSVTFVEGSKVGTYAATPTPKPRPTVTLTPLPTAVAAAVTSTPTAKIETPTPAETPMPRRTPATLAEETATPAPPAEGPKAEQDIAAPEPPQTKQVTEKNAAASSPAPGGESLRSLTTPPSALPKDNLVAALAQPSPRATPEMPSAAPPVGADDPDAVAALDSQYQNAVKANDAATMDRILADDFILVTGRGGTLTKSDLIKAAREKRTNYEHQEPEQGTQKVRIWGDTAVVTSLLRIKGTRDETPLDYKIWSSDTYVRTPSGWQYVFGQTSTPLPKTESPGR